MFTFRAGFSLSRKHYSSILSLRTGHLVHSNTLLSHCPYPIAQFSSTTMQNSPKKPDQSMKRRKKGKADRENSSGFDEVLQADIDQLLRKHKPESEVGIEDASTPPPSSLPETFTEIEVKVAQLSSTGDGLALSENANHVYVVPFTVPGDKALVKVVRHFPTLSYSLTDFIKTVEAGPQRKDSAIGCQYFGKCSGCQLQMMSYEDQLAHKKRIVEKAYANFSGLIPELIPAIGDTFPSPLQYGYRTKLTPHFAGPSGNRRSKNGPREPHTEVPPIGFTYKNQRRDLDIEDCPLGTDIVRKGLKSERKKVAENIGKYKKGATILLRESTARIPKDGVDAGSTIKNRDIETGEDSGDVIQIEREKYTEEKRCVTDPNGTSVEYIDDYFFSNKAGAFFQNNNSILSGFTEYIRQLALPENNQQDPKPIKYLLDAYSGSGLFTITLSPLFRSSLGVDVAGDSIASARENARANSLPNTGFAAADAATLFKDVPYPPDQTLLVIDPPRKGCSDDFLSQLLTFGPRRVVYVSCNVHTQARDVAVMVQGDAEKNIRYEIESIRGFDFFPQTGHVEGVAILNKSTFR
ncbi:tRNA (uracil(54)-C(5))-methyltransferase [Aspergillus alliaceus]|uniref:tRNA (uracil(54)-C(5))-methyltransferase n=1 Tax=Petromyces alliaceus TaxID=209559 RepID=UPI0012A60FFA|nr:S-adenosyl-L-methionine-dependent methyltransferase [Aspergillus alliaceus]KAB8232974.1 S-adenosyl-L-methionine-dependent methyltransferase [Aspergillus alliaceus]